MLLQARRSGCLVSPAGPPVPQAARLALEGWIAHQARYFGSAGRPGRAAQRRAQQVHLQRAAWVVYGLTLALPVLAGVGWGRVQRL